MKAQRTNTLSRAISSIVFGIMTITHNSVAQAATESLLDIYALAKANDHQIKSDYAEFLASRESANINRAALLPQLAATASASHTNTDTRGSAPAETDSDAQNYNLTLNQSIIDRNAWHTFQQGKINAEAAQADYQADELALIIRSAEAYFNVLRATDQLKTAQAEEKAQATLLEQTRQRYEVGLISINDVHETQAAYDSAVAATINAQAQLGIQYDSLTVLTGKFHEKVTPLKNNFQAASLTPSTQKEWVELALKNNYTLRANTLAAKAALSAAKASRSSHLPTLSGSLGYTDNRTDSEIVNGASTGNDTNTATVSLSVNIPLYTGGRLSAQARQAEQTAISAEEDRLFSERSVIQSTRSLYLSVTSDIAQIKARRQAIISNESALDATRAGYDAGTRDIVDVVNAQRNLFQAQRDYFDSLYDYIINRLQLRETSGKLSISDLEALEAELDK